MAGPLNWLSQIFSISLFNLRTLPQRVGSSATAMFGIAGVVAVMVGVLSIAQGILRTMEQSAAPENVVVLRSGSNSEMMSILLGDDVVDDWEQYLDFADRQFFQEGEKESANPVSVEWIGDRIRSGRRVG